MALFPLDRIPWTYTTLALLGTLLLRHGIKVRQRRARATPLRGPPSANLIFGCDKLLLSPTNPWFESWAEEYGGAYGVPRMFGGERVVLYDPTAIAHFYANLVYTYLQTSFAKHTIADIIGRGLIWADQDDHRRQRRALGAGFTNAAIRRMTPVFFDAAHKTKASWVALLEAGNSREIVHDVANAMNHISMDSIGLAGFSHDFGSVDGRPSEVATTFAELDTVSLNIIRIFLGPIFPPLSRLPTADVKLFRKLNNSMEKLADELLEKIRKEKAEDAAGGEHGERDYSIMGLLIRAEGAKLSKDEVIAQMKTLMLAGYQTASITLTQCLIELARRPECQDKLRAELLEEYPLSDPTFEQLQNSGPESGLAYLEAVTNETLRLHPAVEESGRVTSQDDVIPLSTPVRTRTGQVTDRISVPKGTLVTVPIRSLNRSTRFWGLDAQEFRPERWFEAGGVGDGSSSFGAKSIGGYRHVLTFIDGPRICLGRIFAVTEFKAVLCVLLKSFKFELLDGPGTKIERHGGLVPRPKMAGEDSARVPMRISPVERG